MVGAASPKEAIAIPIRILDDRAIQSAECLLNYPSKSPGFEQQVEAVKTDRQKLVPDNRDRLATVAGLLAIALALKTALQSETTMLETTDLKRELTTLTQRLSHAQEYL